MAQKSIHRSIAAFFNEVTPCLQPADWVASGTAFEHLSFDVSGVKQMIMKDPTLEGRALSTGKRKKIKGLRNCECSIGVKMHGTGSTTADGDQLAQTYLGTILKHTMGGSILGYSTTVTGGTSVIPELDSATGIVPGQVLWFEDTTSPSLKNAGKLHPRQVLSIDTLAVTLSEALPFTVAAGDVVHAANTLHLVETWLEDAVASGGTMMWWSQKVEAGTGGTDLLWQIEGSVASMSLAGLSRGELPSLNLAVQAANFKHGADDGLTNKTFTTFAGNAQLCMGIDVQCSIGVYGNTAANYVDASTVAFEPGYTRTRVETTTENVDRFQGTASYTFTPGDTKFTITIPQFSNTWYANLADNTEFRITFYQPGDGSGPGKAWAIMIPRAQLIETPMRADQNENHAVTLTFEAMEPDNVDHDANVELEKSVFLIALG